MPIELTPIPPAELPQGNVQLTALRTGSELPIAKALVWVTSDAGGADIVDGPTLTDEFGAVRFFLADDGAYYFWLRKASERPLKGTAFTANEDDGNTFHTTAAPAGGAASSIATALLDRVKSELRVTDTGEDGRLLRLIDEGVDALQQFKAKTIVEAVEDEDTEAVLSPLDIRYVMLWVAVQFDGDAGLNEALSVVLEQVRDK